MIFYLTAVTARRMVYRCIVGQRKNSKAARGPDAGSKGPVDGGGGVKKNLTADTETAIPRRRRARRPEETC